MQDRDEKKKKKARSYDQPTSKPVVNQRRLELVRVGGRRPLDLGDDLGEANGALPDRHAGVEDERRLGRVERRRGLLVVPRRPPFDVDDLVLHGPGAVRHPHLDQDRVRRDRLDLVRPLARQLNNKNKLTISLTSQTS